MAGGETEPSEFTWSLVLTPLKAASDDMQEDEDGVGSITAAHINHDEQDTPHQAAAAAAAAATLDEAELSETTAGDRTDAIR